MTISIKDVPGDVIEEILQIGNVMGQREMLFNIQKQIVASKGPIGMDVVSNLSRMVEVHEGLFEVRKYESELQQTLRESSVKVANTPLPLRR